MQQIKRLCQSDVLVGVMQRIDEHLWFALIECDVVADLCGVELATFVALPNGKHVDDLWVCRLDGENLALDLLVALECAGPEVTCAGGRGTRNEDRGECDGDAEPSLAGHAPSMSQP